MSVKFFTGNIDPQDICPITHEVFEKPVITACGHLYSREGLRDWIVTYRNTLCPKCQAFIDPESFKDLDTTIEKIQHFWHDIPPLTSVRVGSLLQGVNMGAMLYTRVFFWSGLGEWAYGDSYGDLRMWEAATHTCLLGSILLIRKYNFLNGMTLGQMVDRWVIVYRLIADRIQNRLGF